MTPQECVGCVRTEVLEHNLGTLEASLAGPVERGRDEYWRRVLQGYHTMDDEQKAVLRLVARQTMVDTISNLFGILDGTSLLDKYREDFALTYGAGRNALNGDLQDYFLAQEEEC